MEPLVSKYKQMFSKSQRPHQVFFETQCGRAVLLAAPSSYTDGGTGTGSWIMRSLTSRISSGVSICLAMG